MQKASCHICASITKKFEQIVTHSVLGQHRIQFDYRTRHPKERPDHIELSRVTKSGEQTHRIPVAQSPIVPVFMPVFSAPRFISRLPPTDEFEHQIWAWFPDYQNQADRLNIINTPGSDDILGSNININAPAVMKLAAKIAHCFAYVLYDISPPSILPDYILGRNKFIHNVVGSSLTAIESNQPGGVGWLAEDGIYDAVDKRFYTVKVELLYLCADGKGGRLPPYWVVVCEANDDLAELVLGCHARRARTQ